MGRAQELRRVDAALRRPRGSPGIVLAGSAGVGKSRLAREAVAVAKRRGVATRWVSATTSARNLPLGAFASLIGDVGGADTRVLARAAERVLAGVGRAGVVVAVDDAHLLDQLSALLVHQLVLARAATVLLTIRGGEPAPDAVTALWKDGHLGRLEVQPLSEPETLTLLESGLAGPVDSASAARLYRLTCGNALYLRHLVDGEIDVGHLRQIRGVWRWTGSPRLPSGLSELVETQMGQLSDPVREVVDVLALAEPLGVTVLEQLTDPAAVEQAETIRLVSVERDGRRLQARLAHPLYGEARRAHIGQLRAARLRGRIATALTHTGARRAEDTVRRALLCLESDMRGDPELFLTAAQRAIAVLDVPLAERLARAAVEAGGGFDARLTLASVLSFLGLGEEADAEFGVLAHLARTDAQRAAVALPRAGNLFFPAQRPDAADDVLRDADAQITDSDAHCVVLAARSAFDAYRGRSTRAVSGAAHALASTALPDLAIVVAAFGLVGGLAALGRADEIDTAAARGFAAATRSFAAAAPSWGLCDLHLLGLRLAGYLHAAEDVARAWYQRNTLLPSPGGMGVALLGCAAVYRGQLQTAIRLLRESEATLGQVGSVAPAYRNLTNLTQALAMAGEAGQAGQMLEELERQRHPSLGLFEPDVILAQAWVAAVEGATSEAVGLARRAADLARQRGQPAYEVLALHTAARFGDRTVGARLAELAERVDGPRARAAAAHAEALAGDDGAGLLAASQRLEEMGDLLAALDAAAHSHTAHIRTSDGAGARAAAARTKRLAEACQGARTPAYATVTYPLWLTDREREIAIMAANGLTNRKIADRLVLSVRTVEGHLYRASTKLGTSDRTQLAAALNID